MNNKTRPYMLAESHWKEVREQNYEVAVLPWGALEAHNFHLPYNTDNIETEVIAAESAKMAWEKGAKVIVLPNVPYGVNTGQTDIKLTMNLNPSTQASILGDIIQNLHNSGIPKLLILNGHGGNEFKPMIRELGLKYPDVFIAVCQWFQSVDKKKHFDNTGDHADEMETSLMLHLTPESVLPLNQAGDGAARKFKISAFNESWAWTERQWNQVTRDTGIGNPKKASKEKGEQYFREVTQKISRLLIELSETDVEDMYELNKQI
ncbi:MAG: creatininase family protein [Bacteroidales bacterium]|nr:creatininase family protein [Bacteroidales bacterium]